MSRTAAAGPRYSTLVELVEELAQGLRRRVLPLLGAHSGRLSAGAGAGGDVTFAIDVEAEAYLERFLAERAPGVAYFSEDRGLVVPSERSPEPSELPELAAKQECAPSELPELAAKQIPVLVVDPIDGTRPAMAGLESCCVSVAAAPLGDGAPTMGDVEVGCVVEVKSGVAFVAECGKGVRIDGNAEPALSRNDDLSRLFWSSGFRGRPAEPLTAVLGELIDRSSVGGAFFDLGSACWDLTRILTGQLDAYVDVGSRMIEEQPALERLFRNVGGGAVLNNSPYDLAAAVLLLDEAGACVTDARGARLDGRPLLGSGHSFQMSCVAASNPEIHSQLLEAVERGIRRLSGRAS